MLQEKAEFQVSQASYGLEAVQKATELQPDLILLDIGLPQLNGIEVCKQVLKLTPSSKILFLSQESDPDVVRGALSLGALGYIQKSRTHSELLTAIEAVFAGKRFVSSGLEFSEGADLHQPSHSHKILFCSDEAALLDGLTGFIAAALAVDNPAIVWATESHRESLLRGLEARGLDTHAAMQQGTYISSDVAEVPDPERILAAVRSLTDAASKLGNKHPRVAVCGERAGRLWAEGKTDTAMRLEQLFNELAKSHDMDILCVYPLPHREEHDAFRSLCAEHTATFSR